jgi:enamine deaminase RidA (YjgF/YER057c/UK114 family)
MSSIDFTALLPEGWQRARGYSHGVKAKGGHIVYVAGKTGIEEGQPAGDFGQQFERALGRVVAVMKTAGGAAENICTMRLYVTSVNAYRNNGAALAEAWKKHMGRHFPAMTLVEVTALLQPEAVVEIESEGVLP